ncbi:CocE/NonD family hydrolase [Paracoccus yeei]|nr:CocE/NonD family hydrolase [Paracoccus yeei]MBY0138067.1 CocE/NonD family hydrolase [Paracoccus yeei]
MDVLKLSPVPTPDDAMALDIPMRDGVTLAADLYRPDHGRPTATILIRTPYGKGLGAPMFDLPSIARIFVAHGFSVVAQDVRGRFASGGGQEVYRREIDDGYDTLDWIVAQDWSDGNIGMWGTSYVGFTQLAAAASGHPALKAIVPRMTGTELGFPMGFADGSSDVEHAVFRWYFGQVYADNPLYMFPLDWSFRPLRQIFDPFFDYLGKRSQDFDDSFNPEFFKRVVPRSRLLANPIPTLYTVGTYDMAAIWSWRDVEAMQKSPLWHDKLHLRIEAIDHESYSLDLAPMTDEDDHRKNARARERLQRQWVDPTIPFYDRHLRGFGEGVARVAYQVGKGGWETAPTWPPQPAQAVQFHLDGTGPEAQGRLSLLPVEDRRIARWRHDPEAPVPSIAVTEEAPCGPGVKSIFMVWPDLAPLGERPDVLAFATEPVAGDLLLAGPVDLRAMLASTLTSADLFCRLSDLAPDGTAGLIARGHVRVGLDPVEEGADDEAVARAAHPVHVPLLHASYRLPAGHRLLLHVFGSDFPEYLFNPGDGSETWDAETALAGTHALELGGLRGATLTVTAANPPEAVARAFG